VKRKLVVNVAIDLGRRSPIRHSHHSLNHGSHRFHAPI